MKRKMMFLLMALIISMSLPAQRGQTTLNEEVQEELSRAMEEVRDAMDGVRKIRVDVSAEFNPSDTFMGVVLADLTFKNAYEMRYQFNFGVMVHSVTNGGPAQAAGLMRGDIVMEFAGEKAHHESYLSQLIRSQPVGSTVPVKFFRYDKIYETELTIASRKDFFGKRTTGTGEPTEIKKKRYSVGYGGGSWIPVWYQPDVKEINAFLNQLGFQTETFSENGFLMHGGGGKGNVGKGWFIGGMGAGYSNEETTRHTWFHYNEGVMDSSKVSRKVKYDVSFGGVTLDKRMALSKNLITSLGFMIGTGNHGFKISQKDSNSETENFDFITDPSGDMDNHYDFVSSLKMRKKYIVFQPKVMAMYRILSWLSFRAEVGYMTSYSSKGWEIERNGESIKGINVPSADMNGLTFSIGPWFGF